MIISLIAAISNDGVIGNREGGLPWHLPGDSSHFRSYTAGKWILLGRKTFQEMEGWFTDQVPLVLTSCPGLEATHGHSCNSIEEAIGIARDQEAPELVVCGGATIYDLALPFVKKMIITRVDTSIKDGIRFPKIDLEEWELRSQETVPADLQNEFSMTFQVLTRKPIDSVNRH